MGKERANPYAAPKAAIRARREGDDETGRFANFESARFPLVFTIILSIFSCGLYQYVWWFLRRRFLDGLDSDLKLGLALPIVIGVTSVAGNLLPLGGNEATPLSGVMLVAAAVLTVVANFRVAAMLRSHFRRNHLRLEVSSVGTFFLGIFYLQYKINEGADAELSIPRDEAPRRKKRKKRRAPETEVASPEPSAPALVAAPAVVTDAVDAPVTAAEDEPATAPRSAEEPGLPDV